ncbi:MAG: division/cell wall cluster transcriptional repressor MraZ [Nitrospiraceae bacterium]|nr:division/cell wall cluster transcriptional repressor MraZ [Nitrospiraceae bacterium]
MAFFRGRYLHSLDAKGRVAIPQRFREALGGGDEALRLVMTVDPEGCLVVYPEAVWQELEGKWQSLPQMNDELKTYLRFMVGWASDGALDRQGRILVPPPLREYAGLEHDVWFVGVLQNFEIWNGDRLEKATGRDRVRSVTQKLSGLF